MVSQADGDRIHSMLLDHLSQLIVRADDSSMFDKPFFCLFCRPVQKTDDMKHQPGLRPNDLAQVESQLPRSKNKQLLLEARHAP